MKSHALAKELLDNENVTVMFLDPDSNNGPFSVNIVELETAEEGEFPEDFNMAKGFKYILLTN